MTGNSLPTDISALRVWRLNKQNFKIPSTDNSHKQTYTHLLLNKAIAHGAFLALVRCSVVEIVQLTFVTLVTHKALATVAGPVAVTLHGNGAHWVTVTGWRRTQGQRWMGGQEDRGGAAEVNMEESEMPSCVICVRCMRGSEGRALAMPEVKSCTSATSWRESKEAHTARITQPPLHSCTTHTLPRDWMTRDGWRANWITLAPEEGRKEGREGRQGMKKNNKIPVIDSVCKPGY